MKILNLCKFVALLAAIVASHAQEGDQYWTDYQKAKKTGKVQNQLGYLEILSTRDQGEPIQNLGRKKDAILWFMATGGKNGFANRVATENERAVMEKALMFATFVQGFYKPEGFLSIGYIKNGLNSSNAQEKRIAKHLVEAQKIISLTYVLSNTYLSREEFSECVSEIFENFKNHALSSGGKLEDSISNFSKAFTIGKDTCGKKLIRETLSMLENPSDFDVESLLTNFGFKGAAVQSEGEFQGLVQNALAIKYSAFFKKPAAPQKQIPSYRAMRIVTENGLEITRDSTGKMKIVTTRPVQIGGMNLGAGVTFSGGGGVSISSFKIPANLSDQELLDKIQTYTSILELTDL